MSNVSTTDNQAQAEESILTSLKVPADLWREIKILSVRRDQSANQTVVDALRRELEASQ